MRTETFDEEAVLRRTRAGARPGLVAVFSDGRPCCQTFPLAGGAIEIGREELAAAGLPDAKASRSHLRVEREGREGAPWAVHDLGSRNGTFVDGRPVQGARQLAAPVVRIGRTLLLPVEDCRPFESPGIVAREDAVLGPALRAAHERIVLVAGSGASLLIHGESGVGKELAARAFHEAAAPAGAGNDLAARPFVAVNCATLQKDLAERVLFGARRGAYTGAVSDAIGLVQAAAGGTLFLDEIAELEPGVQAKLLRVLETRTVTPIGGVQPISVSLRLCAATLKDLRAEVAAGRFREDLFFRIGRPALRLPPLRERREEIPWLVNRALRALPGGRTPAAGVELVEACLLREWPGNVRELAVEVTSAALGAIARGAAVITAADLDVEAGRAASNSSSAGEAPEEELLAAPRPEELEAALRAEGGNVARAAARLGLSRSRLRRHIERHGIDLKSLRAG